MTYVRVQYRSQAMPSLRALTNSWRSICTFADVSGAKVEQSVIGKRAGMTDGCVLALSLVPMTKQNLDVEWRLAFWTLCSQSVRRQDRPFKVSIPNHVID